MNWAKGLFRVWVIISVLWIVAIGAFNNTPRDLLRVWDANAELGESRGVYTRETVEGALENAENKGATEDALALRELLDTAFVDSDEIRTNERDRFDSLLHGLIFDLKVLLIPSAVLGFILFGIWWIAGGFAARKKD